MGEVEDGETDEDLANANEEEAEEGELDLFDPRRSQPQLFL